MEMRQLQSFLAVYETGGFRSAASREHLTQSAISRQIQQLERHLGVSLFDRSPRSVVPTAIGRSLYGRVAPLVRDILDALNATRDVQPAGTLKVGYIAPALAGPLPRLIADVRTEFPLVELDVEEYDSAGVIAGLAGGDLDIGYFASDDSPHGLAATRLMALNYGIAVSIDDPLASCTSIDLGALSTRTVISVALREPIHQRILDVLKAWSPGVSLQTAFGFGAVQSLVLDGVGVAPMPLVALPRVPAGVVLRPTQPALPSTTLWAASRRGPTSASLSRVFALITTEDDISG